MTFLKRVVDVLWSAYPPPLPAKLADDIALRLFQVVVKKRVQAMRMFLFATLVPILLFVTQFLIRVPPYVFLIAVIPALLGFHFDSTANVIEALAKQAAEVTLTKMAKISPAKRTDAN